MLALILAMLFCVAIGAGVVGYVMLEARREGRGGFWTPEGEELIAGARRTGEKVRTRGEQLSRTAAERTRGLTSRRPEGDAREPGVDASPQTAADSTHAAAGPRSEPTDLRDRPGTGGYRAAS
ncbi:hypothetical protein [Ornithinimicrobium pekingense]|uniref:Uncharacterized protein n=1 Tax=Ornithinimicrobium pekingense TaxID=384677 RepID=A0ABQ2F7Y9_9MICO|nr:hypothetical protein [Ornithinimicrobium pekingense]GGK62647.1 hypothetical protein GCM10011509_08840 [Ornithinimicrobium pekingense]